LASQYWTIVDGTNTLAYYGTEVITAIKGFIKLKTEETKILKYLVVYFTKRFSSVSYLVRLLSLV